MASGTRRHKLLQASLGLVLTLAAFSGAGFLIFLGPGLLSRALRGLAPRLQIAASILWGVLFTALFHTWALLRDWPLWLCLLALKGLPWALFPLPAVLWEARRPSHEVARALAFGVGLALVARLQLVDPIGFDWETPAAALTPWPWCLSILPWVGLSGLAGFIGMASCLFWQSRRSALLAVLVLAVWSGLSLSVYPRRSPISGPRVALIQTAWDEQAKWDPKNRDAAYRRLFELSAQAAKAGAQLIIWPETAWPVNNLRHSDVERRRLSEWASALGVDLLVSSLEQPGPSWTNSASLVTRTGRFAAEYQKQRLIPFQEYLPLPAAWEAFLRRRNWIRPSCHYKPGKTRTLFESGGRKLAVLICFESVVPGPASLVAPEVDFLVVQANDAGLRSDFAAELHFRSAILRAAEFRKPVFQVANAGVTGFIDARGAVLARTAPGSHEPQIILLEKLEKDAAED